MPTLTTIWAWSNGDIWQAKKLCNEHGLCFEAYVEKFYPGKGSSKPVKCGYITHINTLAGTGGPSFGNGISYMDFIYNGHMDYIIPPISP